MLLVKPVGQAVEKGLGLHGLVERRIEHAHHKRIRHQLLAGLHAYDIGRIVQGRQVIALPHHIQHRVGNHHGARKFLPSVNQPVSHHVNLRVISDDPLFFIHQRAQNPVHRLLVVLHGACFLDFYPPARLIVKNPVNPNALALSLGEHLLCVRVNHLKFQRRAAAVDNLNFCRLPFSLEHV